MKKNAAPPQSSQEKSQQNHSSTAKQRKRFITRCDGYRLADLDLYLQRKVGGAT